MDDDKLLDWIVVSARDLKVGDEVRDYGIIKFLVPHPDKRAVMVAKETSPSQHDLEHWPEGSMHFTKIHTTRFRRTFVIESLDEDCIKKAEISACHYTVVADTIVMVTPTQEVAYPLDRVSDLS